MNAYVPEKMDYAAHWTLNSTHFEQQSCYEWMAGLLRAIAPRKILDIGCGVGTGLLALMQAYEPRIIAIDENAPCLTEAQKRLEEFGYGCDLRLRLGYQTHSDDTHTIETDQSAIRISKRVALVQADILLADPALDVFLTNEEPFDAVTIWLAGSDPKRSQRCQNLSSLRITSAEQYRLRVQNRGYLLASRVLRPGGWLQIVDRGEAPTEDFLREDTLTSHREQAGPAGMEVGEMNYRIYTEPPSGGVGMVASPGSSGRNPKLDRLAMTSVISRKP